ncbi:hypothetical protein GC163_12635 [bacterium]|nr:hypothetical protein [bacterium]
MKMPYGKHKGEEIHTIPKGYLNWMLDNITDLGPDLKQAVEAGLQGKEYTPPTREQRVDAARQDMTARLRARETERILFRVVA